MLSHKIVANCLRSKSQRILLTQRRYILTDAALINKNRFKNERPIIHEDLNGTLRVLKLNPGTNNQDLKFNTEVLEELKNRLETFLTSPLTESVIISSVLEGETLSKGICTDSLKSLLSQDEENRVKNSIAFLRYPYNIAESLYESKIPTVTVYNGASNNLMNAFANFSSLRIATEDTKWSMDQLQKGMLPDVAATALLPKMTALGGSNGQLGVYLLLTGDVLSGEDLYFSGIASHYIPYDAVDDAISRLSDINLLKCGQYLKGEAVTLNSHYLKDSRARRLSSENIEVLKEENNKILNRISLDQYSSALEEFAQPVNSIKRDYSYKYSKEALQVIEYAFNIIKTDNLNSEFAHNEILTRLRNVVFFDGESDLNIKWTPKHIEFAQSTLSKISQVPQHLLEIATRMILVNSQTNNMKSVLAHDQLIQAEFISTDSLLENIESTDPKPIKLSQGLKELLKADSIKLDEKFTLNFNKTWLDEGLIKEKEVRQLIKKKLTNISSINRVISYIQNATKYGSKTSTLFYLQNLMLDRCLTNEKNKLSWFDIKRAEVKSETKKESKDAATTESTESIKQD